MGLLGRLGRVVHVLDHQEIQAAGNLSKEVLIDPGVARVCRDNPQASDFAIQNLFQNLVVGQGVLGGNDIFRDVENFSDLFAVVGIGKIPSRQQSRGVRKQPRAHGVTLTGDGVGAGTGAADVACHQGDVDDGLSRPDALVALVDAHGPPERDPAMVRDEVGQPVDFRSRDARGFFGFFQGVRRDVGFKGVKPFRALREETFVNGTDLDQAIGDPIKERQIGLGLDGVVVGRRHGRFGLAWVHDHNFRVVGVAANPFPHDGVGDARVGPDENQNLGFFKVLVGVRRGIKPERLFVSNDRRGHALARVAVTVAHAHAELGEGAKERHFLSDHLTGAQKRDRFCPMLFLNGLELVGHGVDRVAPRYGFQTPAGVTQEWGRGPVVGFQGVKASHPLGHAIPTLTG